MKEQNFEYNNSIIKQIIDKYQTIWALGHMYELSDWDAETYMPIKGSEDRGLSKAKVSSLIQSLYLNKEFKKLVAQANDEVDQMNDTEKGILRKINRELEEYQKLPKEFLEDYIQTTNKANMIWQKAKPGNDFVSFKPHLAKIIELSKQKAEYLGYQKHPYDALLNLFEEGLTKEKVDKHFETIKKPLKAIFDRIKSNPGYKASHPLEKLPYNQEQMKTLNLKVLELLGADYERLRLDTSSHPFSTNFGLHDSRITTRYAATDFQESLTGTIHEFGHALYGLQCSPQLQHTPVFGGTSLVIHESQSRFWENIIGRSSPFVEGLVSEFKKLSPEIKNYLDDHSLDDLVHYINLVKPSLIRVEADEVTYHFHIALRYEIEVGLMDGDIKVDDLPAVWAEFIKKYLDLEVPTDREGILQDIHWSLGYIGYFPTYSLGTTLSFMWLHKLEKDLGKYEDVISTEAGIRKIQEWLHLNIHQFGSVYTLPQLLKKVLGQEFSSELMLQYLEKKYLG